MPLRRPLEKGLSDLFRVELSASSIDCKDEALGVDGVGAFGRDVYMIFAKSGIKRVRFSLA